MMISLITRLGNLILMLNSSNFCSGYSLQSFGERHILHLQPGIRAVSSLGFLPECPWSGTDKYWTGVSHFSSSSTSSLLRQILLLERSKGDHSIQISRSPPRNQMPVNGENRLGEKPWSSPLWGTDGACKFLAKYPVRSFIKQHSVLIGIPVFQTRLLISIKFPECHSNV